MRLTDEMKEMVERLRLLLRRHCYAGRQAESVSQRIAQGMGRCETVVFGDIASPGTMRNLRSNPFIEINLVDPFLRRGFRFKGRAEVDEKRPEFDFVAEALWSREGRRYPVNAVVKVTIEQALPPLSPVYMFNDMVSEEEVRAIWLKRYGVAVRIAHEVDQGM